MAAPRYRLGPIRPVADRGRVPLPERLLAKLWQAKVGRSLRTTDGLSLRVL